MQPGVTYFSENYLKDAVLDSLVEHVTKPLLKSVRNQYVTYAIIGDALSVASWVVFDVIFDVPDLGDMTTQKVLTSYSDELYTLLNNKVDVFKSQFEQSDISKFESVFDAYIAATNLTIKGGNTYYATLRNEGTLTCLGDVDFDTTSSNCGMYNPSSGSRFIMKKNLISFAYLYPTPVGTLEFAGTEQQTIKLPKASIIEINNTSDEGVIFISSVSVNKLFDHKGNQFTLYNNGSGSIFVDYDSDGLFDNVDPHPTVPESECELKFTAASITLYDNIELNYKVDKKLFEQVGYVQPYVEFIFNSEVSYVSEYVVEGDYYVFNFSNISPDKMNDTVYATLYATHRGVLYHTDISEYSVATYCYNMLSNYSTDEYRELRTLLVDLLNYGAQTQLYTNYKTSSLVNASLTEEQSAWATTTTPEISTVLNKAYAEIENPTVNWLGAGLNLQDSITLRFKIATANIEGLKVKVTGSAGTWWIDSSLFESTDDGYYIYFNCMDASQLREILYLTVYQGNTAVSNTIRYSIESYAYSKQNTEDVKLYNLLDAMMKYGDSAYAYIH